jgi:dihydrofolate reductase
MKISMIAAVTFKGVLGKDNKMLWHLPNDLKHFKQVTMGKPVIMGRKTFESIGKILPGRLNVIISKRLNYKIDGAVVVGSPEEAIAKIAETLPKVEEVMIIGGGEIYEYFMSFADTLHLTMVQADLEGDTYFPDMHLEDWNQSTFNFQKADDKNKFDHAFVKYTRKE